MRTVRLTARAARFDEVAPLLAKVARFDASGQGETVADMVRGCRLFAAFDDDGVIRFAWAFDVIERGGKRIAWCSAVAGDLPGADLLGMFVPVMEGQARGWGCAETRFATVRPGMVKRMVAAGYARQNVTMGKQL